MARSTARCSSRVPSAGLDAGVVAGADGVEPERDGLVQQRRELDVLVAAHARVRGAARPRTRRRSPRRRSPRTARTGPTRSTGCPARRPRDGRRPASSIEQHPREPVRNWSRVRDRAMCTPTTSCPASTARAAATAESTPPDRAARTRIRHRPDGREPGGARPVDDARQRREQCVDVGGGRRVPEAEPQRTARGELVDPHRQQDVAGPGHARLARRPGRRLDHRRSRAGRAASRPRSRGT